MDEPLVPLRVLWFAGGGGSDWHKLKNSDVRSCDVIVEKASYVSVVVVFLFKPAQPPSYYFEFERKVKGRD